jgi:hypothetical protein
MADKSRTESIQDLARERVKESLGALSLEDAVKVATAQVEADEESAKTDKKKPKAS